MVNDKVKEHTSMPREQTLDITAPSLDIFAQRWLKFTMIS
jgi:hypothetical protein